MHAAMFHLDLGDVPGSRERGRFGRALATALNELPGFVAFLAFEGENGTVGGLCICLDAAATTRAVRTAEAWQHDRGGSSMPGLQSLMAGEVIVQRGF